MINQQKLKLRQNAELDADKNKLQKQNRSHLNEISKYLLVDMICQTTDSKQNKSHNISQFINPMFLSVNKQKPSLYQQNTQLNLLKLLKVSQKSQNMKTLFKSIIQMPKLRYQSSQKQFFLKSKNQPLITPTKKKFQLEDTLNFDDIKSNKTSQQKNLFMNKRQFQQKQKRWKQWSKRVQHFDLRSLSTIQKPSISSYIDQSNIQSNNASEQQIQIQKGTHHKSYGFERFNQNSKKQKHQFKQKFIQFQQKQQIKAQEEKNYIQNYFMSAKNKITLLDANIKNKSQEDFNCWC